jgi:hypothetical protein
MVERGRLRAIAGVTPGPHLSATQPHSRQRTSSHRSSWADSTGLSGTAVRLRRTRVHHARTLRHARSLERAYPCATTRPRGPIVPIRRLSPCPRNRKPIKANASECRRRKAFDAKLLGSAEELHSVAFVGDSLAFWARQLRKLACPRCKVFGALLVWERAHGIELYCCRRGCNYNSEHAFNGKAAG